MEEIHKDSAVEPPAQGEARPEPAGVPGRAHAAERADLVLATASAALLFAVVVALPLGVIAAAFHRKPPDFLARFIALFGQSVAAPWLGVMLIFLFAVNLRWLPSSGASQPQSIILPAIVAGAYSAAFVLAAIVSAAGAQYCSRPSAAPVPRRW